jgi:hypothetical protein
MHPTSTVAAALALHDIGMPTPWIAREIGVHRRTVDAWLAGRVPRRRRERERAIPPAPYAYLLGLYLGDGHIVHGPGDRWQLRIACDRAYRGIVALGAEAIEQLVGRPPSLREHPRDRCTRIVSTSRLWPVLLPQHGPGRKHARRIALDGWQRDIGRQQPEALIRGLIHSDGCRFVARQRRNGRSYSYVRYSFSNRSADIRGIFCEFLDLLGIGWTRPTEHVVAIDRRPEVAKLEDFVGPKR